MYTDRYAVEWLVNQLEQLTDALERFCDRIKILGAIDRLKRPS